MAISRRGRPAVDPRVAVDAQGRVVVLWRQVVRTRVVPAAGGRRRQAVYVARARERLVTDARWRRHHDALQRSAEGRPPRAGVSDDGLAVATWHWGTGTSPGDRGYVGQVQFAERRSDGSWSGPRRLSRSPPLRAGAAAPRRRGTARARRRLVAVRSLPADRSTALAGPARPAPLRERGELPFRTDGNVTADLAVAADGRAVAVSADDSGSLAWWRGDVAGTLTLASSRCSARPTTSTPRPARP